MNAFRSLALAAGLFAPVAGWGARISISDLTDTIKIEWSDFSGGLSVNGGEAKEAGTVEIQEAGAISFKGEWTGANNKDAGGSGTVNLLELGTVDNGIGTISDILEISWSTTVNFNGRTIGTMTGSFTSDGDPSALGQNQGVLETGQPQSFGYQSPGKLLGDPDHLFIDVTSDAVPEGTSTAPLLGLALIALGWFRR